MGIENTITKVSEMAGSTSPMGASIKFNFGDSQIVINQIKGEYNTKSKNLLILRDKTII